MAASTVYNVPCQLKTPQLMYNDMLMRIEDNLCEREITQLRFYFRDDMQSRLLENGSVLQWFAELERRGELSVHNMKRLQDVLRFLKMNVLLKEVDRLTLRIKIITLLQGYLGKNGLPSLGEYFVVYAGWKSSISLYTEAITRVAS